MPYTLLGDLYLENCQFGMAEHTYRKALEFGPDPDTEKLLKIARKRAVSYAKAETPGTRDYYEHALMGPAKAFLRGISRKVAIKTSIQPPKILFDEWSAQIRPESIRELTMVGQAIKTAFESDPNFQIVIQGHTDERGSEQRNLKLSKERAEAVKDYLVHKEGIDPARLVTEAYGERKPFSPRKDEEGYSINRRVELFKKAW